MAAFKTFSTRNVSAKLSMTHVPFLCCIRYE